MPTNAMDSACLAGRESESGWRGSKPAPDPAFDLVHHGVRKHAVDYIGADRSTGTPSTRGAGIDAGRGPIFTKLLSGTMPRWY